jgi:glycosyltransferase involved in cell wall biosynthesis
MGGIGRYAASLIRELVRLDTENEYHAYFTHLDLPEDFSLDRRVRAKRFEAGMIDERFDQLVLPTLLETDRIDLYHNPTFAVPVVRTRARIVATVHDVVFRRHPDLVEPKLRSYLHRSTERACKHADRLITVSQFSKAEILDLYDVADPRVTVIHNGVSSPLSKARELGPFPESLRKHDLTSRNYILYVGSIEPKKNLEVLLQAFSVLVRGLKERCPVLALVGSRNDSSYPLESRIEALGLAGAIRVLGYVPADTLEDLYSHARVFVYPSLYEGFGFPPLEAMARGVPTIVSDASSLPEVVGEGALKVAPTNAPALAAVILSLFQSESRCRDLSEKGVERASSFTWRRSAEQHVEVYKEVMGCHERAASRV